MGLGYAISQVPFIKRHEDQLMACLMVLPLVMLSIGLIGSIAVVIRRKGPVNTPGPGLQQNHSGCRKAVSAFADHRIRSRAISPAW